MKREPESEAIPTGPKADTEPVAKADPPAKDPTSKPVPPRQAQSKPKEPSAKKETGKKTQQETASTTLPDDLGQRAAIARGDHADPFLFLGPHEATVAGTKGVVVRVFQPAAAKAWVVRGAGDEHAMETVGTGVHAGGFFALFLPGADVDAPYALRFERPDGSSWRQEDAYRFDVVLSDFDLYLLAEGKHLEMWRVLGSHPCTRNGVDGYSFAVWAPNARRVSVVGDFCAWDGRLFALRRRGSSGVWEIFVPEMTAGSLYKYEIVAQSGIRHLKADPVGSWCQTPPETASRTYASDYTWGDDAWRARRAGEDRRREPMATYEIHLQSFAKTFFPAGGEGDDEFPSYRELAPKVVEHVRGLGFDSVELLPVAEHPFDGSWGYQVTGYFAPTSRFGTPDDFRFFVDHLHQNDIAVLVDWVPAHFVKDAHGLGRFDGTALYEHEDPRRGEHPDWGTYVFNYGRFEVRNFLVANALYWLEEMHVDGLRVDAVASMLYLDYSREDGAWLPNHHGGRENYDAIELLREVNQRIQERCPGCFTVAEESTAWPDITTPVADGGLGFDFKWNMGWMHDSLGYFQVDPFFRSHHHDKLTFAMVYEHSEAFVNPLSHDEVVHGKGSLWTKMPGDPWRKAANLRALFAYQFTRPGKILLFMGSELGSPREWNHGQALDIYLLDDPERRGLRDWVAALGALYQEHACLWRLDHDPAGFQWIACHDRSRSVYAYARYDQAPQSTLDADPDSPRLVSDSEVTGDHLLVVLNLTPVPREKYRLGAPAPGSYRVLLSSDEARFGGSGYEIAREVTTEAEPCDGWRHSFVVDLPPMAALVLGPVGPPLQGDEAG